jgi:ubiquitin C-terminal hydrolase
VYLQSNDGPLYIPSQTILMRETIDREILQSLLKKKKKKSLHVYSLWELFLAFFFDFFCMRVVSVPELHMEAFRFASLLDTFLWPFNLCFMFVSLRCVFECGEVNIIVCNPTANYNINQEEEAKKNIEADRGREEIYVHIYVFLLLK